MDTDQSVNISSNATETTNRTRRPENRAPEIARAALELFVTKGFAATKLDDVARAAGVSKGLPYLYFKNKEELFKAVIVEAIGEPLVRADELVDAFEGSTEELQELLLLTSLRSHPNSIHQLVSCGIYPERQRILVAKGTIAPRAAYEGIAKKIVLVDSPGATAVNPAHFRYERARPGLFGLS